MATAAELARLEAERAEREDDDDEHDDELEPEHDDALEPALEKEWPAEPTDAMFAAARELNLVHQAALQELFGPFVEGFTECDACGGAGLAPPPPSGPKYQHDPNKETCSVCAGQGQLETGSQREGFELENCDNCNGKGYVGPTNKNAVDAARAAIESVGGNGGAAGDGAPPAQPPAPQQEDPRVAELQALGYAVVAPFRS